MKAMFVATSGSLRSIHRLPCGPNNERSTARTKPCVSTSAMAVTRRRPGDQLTLGRVYKLRCRCVRCCTRNQLQLQQSGNQCQTIFPSVVVPLPLSRCMEGPSYVLSFRMVFFYLVTTGWISDISLHVRIPRRSRPTLYGNEKLTVYENGPNPFFLFGTKNLVRQKSNLHGNGFLKKNQNADRYLVTF